MVKTVFKVVAEALESVRVGGEAGRGGCVCGLKPAPSISPQSHALHLQTYTFFFLFFNDLF